jgi:Fe-S-cluster containining protein
MSFPENVTRLCGGKRFSFGCHPDLACFTECCRELELALTPYDVLCLCRELQMRAAEFIDRYVVIEEDAGGGFPRLYLGMVDDGRASCPFIAASGCRVYRSRPGACRAYPVGRGVSRAADGKVREIYVLIQEAHCRGFAEPHSRNVAEWFENQGLIEYNAINDEVLDLLQGVQAGQSDLTREEKEAFLLALYRLDEFREMITSPDFYDQYLPDENARRAVLADELALLRFGIRWLQQLLFPEKT